MKTFRHSAGFGKRIEFWIIGQMLKQGLDVYVPLVDDNGIDAVVRRPDGSFVEVQIKARGIDVNFGDAGLFAAIVHELRNNYWFVFYSERLQTMWIMTSAEFIEMAHQNKNGKNIGKRSIWFNGKRRNKETGEPEEHVRPQFQRYIAADFSRIEGEEPKPIRGQHVAAAVPHRKAKVAASLRRSPNSLRNGSK